MSTYPTYFQFGDLETKFYRDLSPEEARDEYFAAEELVLHFQNGPTFALDLNYEAPLFRDGKYYFIFKEHDAEVQQ